MPPTLRSSRAASRAASHNSSRPQTPQDAPSNVPSASLSEPARPNKQRKTGRNTKTATAVTSDAGQDKKRKTPAATTAPASTTVKKNASNGNTKKKGKNTPAPNATAATPQPEIEPDESQDHDMANAPAVEPPESKPTTWEEPPPVQRTRGLKDDSGKPKFNTVPTRESLETRPSAKALENADRLPRSTGSYTTRGGRKVNSRSRTAAPAATTTTNAAASTTASEQPAPSDVSQPGQPEDQSAAGATTTHSPSEDDQNVASRNDTVDTTAAATPAPPSTSAPPTQAPLSSTQKLASSLPVPNEHVAEKLRQILDLAISRAGSLEDPRIVDGLSRIRNDSTNDPFLLSVVAAALNEGSNSAQQSAFQKVMREAIRRSEVDAKTSITPAPASASASAQADTQADNQADTQVETQVDAQVDAQAPAPAADDMTRTQSAISTSSLSSAKSVDAQNFTPEVTEQAATTAATTTGAAPRQPAAASRRGKGKKRGGRTTKSTTTRATGKRKRNDEPVEHPPELSNEAIANKRRQLDMATISANHNPEMMNLRAESGVRQGSIPPPTREYTPSEWTETGAEEQEAEAEAEAEADAETEPQNQGKTSANKEERDNNDFCTRCRSRGNLICCDGCINSYHFRCVGIDKKNKPKGEWYCEPCKERDAMEILTRKLDTQEPTPYGLPPLVRDGYTETHFDNQGRYDGYADASKPNRERAKGPESLEAHRLRLTDNRGRLITCRRCSRTSEGSWPLIQCDHCPDYWHIDCVEPILSHPPTYTQETVGDKSRLYWKCPNHVQNILDSTAPTGLGKYRQPRHPKYIDIEVIPEDDAEPNISDLKREDTVYRVPQKGVILDFIARVKRDRADEQSLAAYANARAQAVLDQTRRNADAYKASAMNSLDAGERQAVEGLMGISEPQPAMPDPERHGHLVTKLVADAPTSVDASATSEVAMLRSIQDLVKTRLRDLAG